MSRVWNATKTGRAASLRQRSLAVTLPIADWDAGYAAGRQAAAADHAEDQAMRRALIAAIAALTPPSTEPIEQAAAVLAGHLAIAAAGKAGVDTVLLHARARAAVNMLAHGEDVTILRLNPADHALFTPDDFDCRVEIDETLARGDVRVRAGHAWAADGVTQAIDRIRAALDIA